MRRIHMDFRNSQINSLYEAILELRTVEECQNFFEDLCTIKELQDMAQRLDAAVMLKQGHNYQMISREIGISTATISRVSKCINYGSGGYNLILERLLENGEEK